MVAFARFAAVLATFALTGAVPLLDRASPPLPVDDPFYKSPGGIDDLAPGTIIKSRKPPNAIAAFGSRVNIADSRQILYRSTDSFGDAIANVATILIPHNADLGKMLSYQVAEDSATPNCAPSFALQLEAATSNLLDVVVTQAELLLIEAALEQGWIVLVPDHEGPQGAFLANKQAGHVVLDAIRAALGSSEKTGIKKDARVAIWGYSGGSVATSFAAELQPTYAPELKIAGAALGGTVPNIYNAFTALNRGALSGIMPSGVLGFANAYPEVAELVKKHLKPEFKDYFYKAKNQCLLTDVLTYPFMDVIGMFDDREIFTKEPAKSILQDNSLGKAVPTIPLYVYKSIPDEVSPVRDSDDIVKLYCSKGASVEYKRDLVSEHNSLAVTGAPGAIYWIKGILEGKKPKQGCSTKSVVSTLLDKSTVDVVPKFILDALLDLLGKKVGPIIG